ncbi:MAG: hypothetical protein JRI68_03505 [Deltaproteobacteria bacterium]|nr:hypothetical protein [Deltaproteobacteria bacterium]
MGSKCRKSGVCSSFTPIALGSLLLAVAGCAPHAAQSGAATADDASGAMTEVTQQVVVEPRHVHEPKAFARATYGSQGSGADRANVGAPGHLGRDPEPQPPIPPICTLCP